MSFAEISSGTTVTLLLGGVFAAPLAAWLVRKLPARILGVAVAGVFLITNARTLLTTQGVEGEMSAAAYLLITAAWLLALSFAVLAVRRDKETGGTASEAAA